LTILQCLEVRKQVVDLLRLQRAEGGHTVAAASDACANADFAYGRAVFVVQPLPFEEAFQDGASRTIVMAGGALLKFALASAGIAANGFRRMFAMGRRSCQGQSRDKQGDDQVTGTQSVLFFPLSSAYHNGPMAEPTQELKIGQKAPEIRLNDDEGKPFDLAALAGKTVVLYFYPKSDTPGCTTESCEFRDADAQIAAKGAVVVGISPDKVKAQEKFRAKFSLPFRLLADEQHEVCEAYGVWVEKSMYGRKYMGVERSTFVIGPDGRITSIFRKVSPKGHATEVLSTL
jgi:thioredoxin-dependent peroxiredoxin